MGNLELQDDLPEHLACLTDLQLAFVANYVQGEKTDKDCAIAAGYAEASAHVAASRLIRNPKVLNAIHTETMLKLTVLGPAAVRRMGQLIDGAKSEYVRLEASKDVLNRLGLKQDDGRGSAPPVTVNINL